MISQTEPKARRLGPKGKKEKEKEKGERERRREKEEKGKPRRGGLAGVIPRAPHVSESPSFRFIEGPQKIGAPRSSRDLRTQTTRRPRAHLPLPQDLRRHGGGNRAAYD